MSRMMKSKNGLPAEWKMQNGNFIEISEMTDTHLRNTINMLDTRMKEMSMLYPRLMPYKKAMEIELKERMYRELLEE